MVKKIIPLLIFLSFLKAQIALPTFQAVQNPQSTAISSLSLFDFTTHTFTNCGQTGHTGPSLSTCKTWYQTNSNGTSSAWRDNTDYFNMEVNGIQMWTVPTTGTYTIEAWGAQGGRSNEGYGARMRGDFTLTSGTVLKILVGQEGGDYSVSTSGGGGTFVAKSDNTPLIVAGGGGGHRNPSTTRRETTDGDTLEAGRNGYFNGSLNNGGTSGSGGTSDDRGGAGAGFSGDGEASTDNRGSCSPSTSVGASAFTNGGTGGWGNMYMVNDCNGAQRFGGFGGGGSGGWGGAGGGGGYSGGGADTNSGWSGGGGSYNSGTNQSNSIGANSSHGKVVITIN
tara:strand:+ start:305 stop:1315 length:1011 start_codon:yes stop_codon:yes gene_type:complete